MLSLGLGKINPINFLRDIVLNKLTNSTLSFTKQNERVPEMKYADYGLNSASFLINLV